MKHFNFTDAVTGDFFPRVAMPWLTGVSNRVTYSISAVKRRQLQDTPASPATPPSRTLLPIQRFPAAPQLMFVNSAHFCGIWGLEYARLTPGNLLIVSGLYSPISCHTGSHRGLTLVNSKY